MPRSGPIVMEQPQFGCLHTFQVDDHDCAKESLKIASGVFKSTCSSATRSFRCFHCFLQPSSARFRSAVIEDAHEVTATLRRSHDGPTLSGEWILVESGLNKWWQFA